MIDYLGLPSPAFSLSTAFYAKLSSAQPSGLHFYLHCLLPMLLWPHTRLTQTDWTPLGGARTEHVAPFLDDEQAPSSVLSHQS